MNMIGAEFDLTLEGHHQSENLNQMLRLGEDRVFVTIGNETYSCGIQSFERTVDAHYVRTKVKLIAISKFTRGEVITHRPAEPEPPVPELVHGRQPRRIDL